jgi:formylglycine-generating enzyme required for sulfatase activity
MSAAREESDPLGWVGTTRAALRIDRVREVDGPCVAYDARGADDRVLVVEVVALASVPDDDRRAAILDTLRRARKTSESDPAIAPVVGHGVEIDRTRAFVFLAWPRVDAPAIVEGTDGAPLELLGAIERLAPLARALDAVHAAGATHGSIDARRLVRGRILGFGRKALCDAVGARPRSRPPDAAPEHVDVALGPLGPWTDVFSLALSFVTLVVGRSPLADDLSYVERLMDRARRPTPRACGVGVSAKIETILSSALAVDPRARPSKASLFWDALLDAVHASPSTFSLVPAPALAPAPTPARAPSPAKPARLRELERYAIASAIVLGISIFAVERWIRSRPGTSTSASASASAPSASTSAFAVATPSASIAPSASASVVAAIEPKEMIDVDGLLVDRTEITVAAYKSCMTAGGCTPTRETSIAYDKSDSYRKYFLCNLFLPAHDDHPINCLTFKQADAFCTWKGKRLPTAKEWTRAAGGEHRRFPWGGDTPTCARVVFARYGAEQWGCRDDVVGTAPVDTHPDTASPAGIVDLAGNVWEWTTERGDAGTVLRGGGWDSSEKSLEISARLEQAIYNGEVNVGARCVK